MGTLPATNLTDLKIPQDVRISTNGHHVVYSCPETFRAGKNIKSALWVADTNGRPRPVTSGKFFDSAPSFAPDGTSLAFLSDRDNPGKLSTLYQLPVVGFGEARPLTSTANKQAIDRFEWSPDGKHIAYLSADEKTAEQKRKEDEGDDAQVEGENLEHARLRILEVRTGKVDVASPDAHVAACSWSPDSTAVAYLTRKGSGLDDAYDVGDICIFHVQTQQSSQVCHLEARVTSLTWTEDGLYWIAPTREPSACTSRTLWRAESKPNSSMKPVAYGQTDCAAEIRRCGTKAVVRVLRGISDHLELIPSMKSLNTFDHELGLGWDVVLGEKAPTIAYVRGSVVGGEVLLREADKETRLSRHHGVEEDQLLGRTERIEFTADDATPIDGVIYFPAHAKAHSGRPAAVVWVHGGPYSRSAVGANFWVSWFLAQGYAVLLPNYRGGSGHGADYAEAVHGNAAASYQDVITLVKRCIAEGTIDARRTAIAGWSQGGFMAYLAVTRSDTFHFAAAVAGAGVSCWDTMAMTSDLPTFEADLGGTTPWLAPIDNVTARRSSPLWHMDQVTTPLLILHGEDDERVPVSQARRFHRGLEARGKSCDMVIYPREGHGSDAKPFERAHAIHMLDTVAKFLAKHLTEDDGSQR